MCTYCVECVLITVSMSNSTLCVLSICICILHIVICRSLQVCTVYMYIFYALSGARSQEFHSPRHTCCGEVTIKVIWFDLGQSPSTIAKILTFSKFLNLHTNLLFALNECLLIDIFTYWRRSSTRNMGFYSYINIHRENHDKHGCSCVS